MPEETITEYEIVDADGVTHTFPLTLEQLGAAVGAGMDLGTRTADIIAQLARDLGINGAVAPPDAPNVPPPYMDPERGKLTLAELMEADAREAL